METTADTIACHLSGMFAERGFASLGVDALRDGAKVSLRTLYKYYPSREAMIIGALEYRNAAYLKWIRGGDDEGQRHILHIFERLGEWFVQGSTNGCLFLNALAAHPESRAVRQLVEHHKDCIKAEFARRLNNVAPDIETDDLAEALFVIHEGQTEAAMTRDPVVATRAALRLAAALLDEAGIPS